MSKYKRSNKGKLRRWQNYPQNSTGPQENIDLFINNIDHLTCLSSASKCIYVHGNSLYQLKLIIKKFKMEYLLSYWDETNLFFSCLFWYNLFYNKIMSSRFYLLLNVSRVWLYICISTVFPNYSLHFAVQYMCPFLT